jgi:HEAT repeat protein
MGRPVKVPGDCRVSLDRPPEPLRERVVGDHLRRPVRLRAQVGVERQIEPLHRVGQIAAAREHAGCLDEAIERQHVPNAGALGPREGLRVRDDERGDAVVLVGRGRVRLGEARLPRVVDRVPAILIEAARGERRRPIDARVGELRGERGIGFEIVLGVRHRCGRAYHPGSPRRLPVRPGAGVRRGVDHAKLPFLAAHVGAPAAAGLVPGAPDLEAGHAELRRAAIALERDVAPVIDLEPAARAIEEAFSALFDAFDGRADRALAARASMEATGRAAAAIEGALSAPGFAAIRNHLGAAHAHLVRAEDRLARIFASPAPEPPDLLVSVDVPRLHTVARRSMAPRLKVPKAPPAGPPPAPLAPLPEPTTFEELRAVIGQMKQEAAAPRPTPPALPESAALPARPPPPPGFAAEIPAALSDADFVRARTRECFEEVAMVGMQRAPLLGDPWRGSLLLERRMLASIDVVAAMGEVAIEHVPRLVADAPVKDPSRGFGIAMILGCVGGRDALAAAEHALLSSDRDAAFVEEVAAALKLVPHDHVAAALGTLLRDPDPAIRAAAIDVLGYRGLATSEELAAAATDAPPVAARALVHLASAPTPDLPGLLEAAAAIEDAPLREAVWTAMALSGDARTSPLLRAALAGDHPGAAALILAIAGDEEDARAVIERAFAAPARALVTAVGWTGDARAFGPLVDLLETSEDDEVRFAAAWALERITGAGLWEDVEVPEEEILVPDPPEPDVGEPRAPALVRVLGADPRDPPPEPAPEVIEHPTLDPARWRAYWTEKGPGYEEGGRYRRGFPYTPLVSLHELDAARCTPVERRWLGRELVIRTGSFVRFDPHDFVVVQEESLRAWQPVAARASSHPGRWVRPARRAAPA